MEEEQYQEFSQVGENKTKEELIKELERIDEEIIRLHDDNIRFRSRRAFMSSPRSEILKIKRSFIFKRICELERDR